MRRAARRDNNEAEVIAALRAAGWTVQQLGGTGLPDLLLMRAGRILVAEVKQEGGRIQAAQVDLHAAWEAAGCPIPVVTSPDEAVRVMAYLARDGTTPWLRPRTYRDFPWEGFTAEQKAKRLAAKK